MIRVTATLDTTALDNVERFARELPKAVQTVGKPIVERYIPLIIAAVSFYPPPKDFPYGKYPWKSERQRRAVMAKLHGKKYERTFELRRAWRVTVNTANGRLVMSIVNTAPSAQFVVGRLNQRSRAEAIAPIQPAFLTYWRPAVDTVAPYFALIKRDFTAGMSKRFHEAVAVRSTRRSAFA